MGEIQVFPALEGDFVFNIPGITDVARERRSGWRYLRTPEAVRAAH
jgi:hypothetical protein